MYPIAALKARVWNAQGKLAEALRWVREQGVAADDDLCYTREFEHITLARLLIARYQHDQADRVLDDALDLLGRLLQAAETGGRMGSVIEILVLQALAYESQDNTPMALAALERALALAGPEGYVRIFVDEGLPMAYLLSTSFAQGVARDYAGKLLAAFEAEEPRGAGVPAHATTPPPQPLVEPLSLRELEVLQLIAQGLSNREISERLFLALSTVKGHNRRIFGKLTVQNRTEAAARARELDLL
jgi:LuxR family maltose regulon positive regulatory protein